VSTRLCQTRFRLFSPFGANANTNEKEMNNGSKYYSTVCDSREKASISFFLFFIPVNCAYRKEETSIIIEMEYLLIYFHNYKNKPGTKKSSFFKNNKKVSPFCTVRPRLFAAGQQKHIGIVIVELLNLFRVRHTWQTQVYSSPQLFLFSMCVFDCLVLLKNIYYIKYRYSGHYSIFAGPKELSFHP
jgi:hypothetical protein